MAGVHDQNAVRNTGDNAQVVGDEHHRCMQIFAECTDQIQDLRLHRHIERRRGFVGDEHLGIGCDRDSNHHPLSHTTTKFVWIATNAPLRIRDADGAQQFEGEVIGRLRP